MGKTTPLRITPGQREKLEAVVAQPSAPAGHVRRRSHPRRGSRRGSSARHEVYSAMRAPMVPQGSVVVVPGWGATNDTSCASTADDWRQGRRMAVHRICREVERRRAVTSGAPAYETLLGATHWMIEYFAIAKVRCGPIGTVRTARFISIAKNSLAFAPIFRAWKPALARGWGAGHRACLGAERLAPRAAADRVKPAPALDFGLIGDRGWTMMKGVLKLFLMGYEEALYGQRPVGWGRQFA